VVVCPEDPLRLAGQPIGMYHCGECGCMQVAGMPHMCDPEDCLLEDCDCLPPGVHRSPNLEAWLARPRRLAPDERFEDVPNLGVRFTGP
jgi:hypothetical protein